MNSKFDLYVIAPLVSGAILTTILFFLWVFKAFIVPFLIFLAISFILGIVFLVIVVIFEIWR